MVIVDTPKCYEVFQRREIPRKGHFVGTSGEHMDRYVDKYVLYPYLDDLRAVCFELAHALQGYKVGVVAAPAQGGIFLALLVASYLGALTKSEVHPVFAERDERSGSKVRWVFKHGFGELVTVRRVAVVDDTATTGKTIGEVVDAVRDLQGRVVVAGVLCAAPGTGKEIGPEDVGNVELVALASIERNVWDPGKCPLCKHGVPIDKNMGKG